LEEIPQVGRAGLLAAGLRRWPEVRLWSTSPDSAQRFSISPKPVSGPRGFATDIMRLVPYCYSPRRTPVDTDYGETIDQPNELDLAS